VFFNGCTKVFYNDKCCAFNHPYTSPHICKVLLLPKQNRAMATYVLTKMHDLMWEYALPNDGTVTNNEKKKN
jgi:hypothetical protein